MEVVNSKLKMYLPFPFVINKLITQGTTGRVFIAKRSV